VPADVRRAAVATGVVLSYGVVAHRLAPTRTELPANLGAAAAAVLVARAWGHSWADLGLDPSKAGRGARNGLVASAPLAAGLAVVAAVPAIRPWFRDERVVGTSTREAAGHVLVRIPLATALAEELLFRAVLLAVTDAALRRRWAAIAWTSLVFGAWHVVPALHAHRNTPEAAGRVESYGGVVATIAGTVAATTVAGVGLAVLRLRARSVLAPVVAHAVVNAAAFLVARRAGRTRG
jgi:membrane protease YdiL (CAAX protease family)